jgi:hypothetical protein
MTSRYELTNGVRIHNVTHQFASNALDYEFT